MKKYTYTNLKRIISVLLCLVMLITAAPASAIAKEEFPLEKGSLGATVIAVQQRLYDLGYLSFRATGRYGDMTVGGIRKFQQRNSLPADGICGKDTYDKLFSDTAKRNSGNANVPRIVGPQKNVISGMGVLEKWDTIAEIFGVGNIVTVTDYNTGKTFKMRRTGGINHADCETVDAASYETYKSIFNGAGTWERRAIHVQIEGTKYAASIIGMPTGATKGLTMSGTVDMYFFGSMSDFFPLGDVEHATAVKTANGQ